MFQFALRILLICFLFSFEISARQTDKKTDLVELLNQVRDQYNINLAYDPDLLSGFKARQINTNEGLEYIIAELNEQLPFSFNLLEGSYLIIKTKPVSLNLTVKDASNGSPIPGVYIKKNDQYAKTVSGPEGEISLNTDWKKSDSLSFEFTRDCGRE